MLLDNILKRTKSYKKIRSIYEKGSDLIIRDFEQLCESYSIKREINEIKDFIKDTILNREVWYDIFVGIALLVQIAIYPIILIMFILYRIYKYFINKLHIYIWRRYFRGKYTNEPKRNIR